MKTFLVGASLVLVPAASWADGSIQTDRPDFVESSNTVGKGIFQIETSLSWEENRTDGVSETVYSTPTLLRYGVADMWEVRLETEGRVGQITDDPANQPETQNWGYADYSIGLKWHQRDGDEKTLSPSIGWLVHLDMPGGSSAFKSHDVRPSIRGVAEWELPNGYSFGIMPGVIYDVNENSERFYGTIFGAVMGKSFSETLRGFVEFAGEEFRSEWNGGSQLTANIGAAYLLSNDMQIDASVCHGLNKYTPDNTFSLGLSARF